MSKVNTKQPVAFFDIDGTLFRSSLLIELVESLIKEQVFPFDARDRYYSEYVAWLNREGSYESYIKAVIDTYLENIKGVHYGDLADIGKRVVSLNQQRVYRHTRNTIIELKQEGYYLVAISQSPKTILDEFCRGFGFDKVYGRIYEIGPQDKFTGVVTDEHLIENKAAIAQRVFKKGEVDPTHSIAFGDTEGDISLLESVTDPVCFNPNKKLYHYAKKRQWPIVVERKDVIYHL